MRACLERSHHALRQVDGSARVRAVEPHPVPDVLAWGPLEPPCEPIEQLPVTRDLRRMRREVNDSEAVSALPPAQCQEFVLAVNEAATNALQYGEPPQAVRLWRRGDTVVGEVIGRGRIEDPLVGRRRPAPNAIRGRGIWMVNQLCDLVELRSSPSRTTLRMHKRCLTG
jgi:anti-sigma regulatory factor (Ser/Thr protein kinase)